MCGPHTNDLQSAAILHEDSLKRKRMKILVFGMLHYLEFCCFYYSGGLVKV